MPFIGNQPALSYTSFAKQDFTTSATTSYTLDHPVTNENEIALFINFVRQEPTTAYTATNTSLTLTSATSATDDMYCVFLGKAVQTVNPPSGSVGLSQLSATGTKDATTFLRGDNTFAVAGGDNTPAFFATNGATRQTLSHQTTTKIDFGTEIYDTDSAFASSRFTVPSGQAGKYFIYASADIFGGSNDIETISFYVYKNGSLFGLKSFNGNPNARLRRLNINFSYSFDLSVNDYLEFYVQADTAGAGSMDIRENNSTTFFGGYKLIGV